MAGMKPAVRLALFVALLTGWVWLATRAEAAQAPQDLKLPDALVVVAFKFDQTIVDVAGVKPTITRPAGSVEIKLADISQPVTARVYNPASKQMEDVVFSPDEIAALLRAIGEKKWLEVNPPPLPVNRRSVREPGAVASLPVPKPQTP